jgi:hypothetical protein
MGRGRDLRAPSRAGATKTAPRLGVADWIGVLVGVTVAGRRPVYASVEDMITLIAGLGVGKSVSYVIPAVAVRPGAVLTTSNKSDVLDATRDLRATKGRVWVFDPQQIALEEPEVMPVPAVTASRTGSALAMRRRRSRLLTLSFKGLGDS